MNRRDFLESIGTMAALALVGGRRVALGEAPAPAEPGWRTFELTTRLEILEPTAGTRAWVPLPLMAETAYQKRLGDTWGGNGTNVRVWRDDRWDAGVLCAEWPSGGPAPVLEVVSRFSTRDRAVDLSAGPRELRPESPRVLKATLEPTALLPLDGVVGETSRRITAPHRTTVAKARAIYEWIVENTFRDPKVRGCGTGDIRSMLESGYLGGKCADLNGLFVGLARASGIPAREVFGVRVAESKEWKSLGKSGEVSKAQHCRAEFYDQEHGWVPVDPADVRKVALEEPPGQRPLADATVQKARRTLFGRWEMNYLVYNVAHDLRLPGASGGPLPFLMYPQGETAAGKKDSLDPTTFKYTLTSREIS